MSHSKAARFIYIFSFSCISSFAQYQPPPFLHWQKITTPHFKIVFPRGLEPVAQETASLMDYMFETVPDVYKVKTKKINLYLNNQTTVSNGYVTLGPRYMEWYIHPPQSTTLVNTDWKKLLAVHEYRHVVQFDYFNRHFTKGVSIALGDLGMSLLLPWSVPRWYMEGDAVSAETILTNNGRGRMPSFDMEWKAILTGTERKTTYDQAYLGSYKNYFPDYYHLGYMMHTHVSRTHSIYTWPKVINRVNKLSYLPFSFSQSLKKFTGFTLRSTYRNTINGLKNYWADEYNTIPADVTTLSLHDNKVRTNYRFAHYLADGSLVCLRYGMADEPEIVKITASGDEKVIAAVNNNEFITSNGRYVVWSSYAPDIRWGERNYENIIVYDAEKNRIKRVTRRGKYGAPSISPSGEKIAAVRFDDKMTYSIVILDAQNGKKIQEYDFGRTYVRTPSWSDNGEMLVFTTTSDSIVTLSILDLESGKREVIIRSEAENISKPVFWKDYILFNSSITGKDAIHAVRLSDRGRYIALTGGYGFFNPVTSSSFDELLVETYVPDEYRVCKWLPDESEFIPLKDQDKNNEFYISPVIANKGYTDIFKNYKPDTLRKIERYSHILDGIKVHSWIPSMIPYQTVKLNIYAGDPLSQINLIGQFEVNYNESNTFQGIALQYGGMFPVLEGGFEAGKRTGSYLNDEDSVEYYQWTEKNIYGQVLLPFDISTGAFYQNINIKADYRYIFKDDIEDRYLNEFDYGNSEISTAGAAIDYVGYRQMSVRDFYPRFGGIIHGSYEKTLEGSDYTGWLQSASVLGFFPGLLRHHSLRLNVVYEKQDPGVNSFER